MDDRLLKLKEIIERETLAELQRQHGTSYDWTGDATVTIKPGTKYTKVNVGTSGKYMVDNATGEIFGCKGYGVIHRGHRYGTLDSIDDWAWGEYRASRRTRAAVAR